MTLPYRVNVGAVLFGRDGRVLIARRAPGNAAAGAWQFPQGGIDEGEDPASAVLRELAEEIGTDRATILGEHPEWLTYDFPPDVQESAMRGRYQGQKQRWFALRFEGEEADIRLDATPHPEFDAWRWIALSEAPAIAPGFKQAIYEEVSRAFARFASPSGPSVD